MEESEKMNGKKRLPSIPSNYVTLLQLQERWNKERERKQKGKEEKEEPQQQQQQQHEEKKTNVEERVNDEVSGRGSRKSRRFPRVNRDNGKRVAEEKPRDEKTVATEDKKPRDEKTAAVEDFDNDKKGEESKKKNKNKNNGRKKRNKKRRNEMEDKANEGEELTGLTGNAPLTESMEHGKGEEELIGDEVHSPKLMSSKEKNVEARRESRTRLFPTTRGRSSEIGRKFQAVEHSKGEEELMGNEVHAPKLANVEVKNVGARREWRPRSIPINHGHTAEIGQKFQVIEHNKEEKPIRDEVHAPKLVVVEEENVDVRGESQPRSTPRTHGGTAEIGRKFQAMSVNDEIKAGYNRRRNFNFNHRGGYPELNGSNYRKFDRRRELKQSNQGMVWVKKGEVEDQNVSGVQISSKELD